MSNPAGPIFAVGVFVLDENDQIIEGQWPQISHDGQSPDAARILCNTTGHTDHGVWVSQVDWKDLRDSVELLNETNNGDPCVNSWLEAIRISKLETCGPYRRAICAIYMDIVAARIVQSATAEFLVELFEVER